MTPNQLTLPLTPAPARYPVGLKVMTPYGDGVIEERRAPGEWLFDHMIFADDGTQPAEPVYWVRTATHTVYACLLESELTPKGDA